MHFSMDIPVTASATDATWEAWWSPYDQATYDLVLEQLSPQDVVLDIGAGDLRLSRQMAAIARTVYAVEIQAPVFAQGLQSGAPLPPNLIPILADARVCDFPAGVTVGVLLMRHCTHFQLYAEKLRAVGAERLMTNARWRMGIEVVQLHAARLRFADAPTGWYTCWCGEAGFKEGCVAQWSPELDALVNEVSDCPHCCST